MGSLDLFGLVFGLIGIVYILSSAYEWTWWWRLGLYLPNLIGWKMTRLVYLVTGFGALGVGAALVIQSLFSISQYIAFMIGFILSAILTRLIYESREEQSITEIVNFKVRNKQKSKPLA